MPSSWTILAPLSALAVEMAVLLFAAVSGEPYRLRGLAVARPMILISLFAPLLMHVNGLYSNVGNIWYATAIMAQCIILERWGSRAALDTVVMVYTTLATLFAACAVLPLFPVVPGNEEWARAIHMIAARNVQITVASFSAFGLAQLVLIWVYVHTRHAFGPLVAMIMATVGAQIIDSVVFFPLAFWPMTPLEPTASTWLHSATMPPMAMPRPPTICMTRWTAECRLIRHVV